MGILSDLKKLFFAQSSVAKSTGKKFVDESKGFTADIKEEAAGAWEKAKKTGEKLAEDASEKINALADSVDLDGTLEKARDFTRRMTTPDESQDPDEFGSDKGGGSDPGKDDSGSDSRSQQGSEWLEKASENAADLGRKASDNFKDASEKLGKKAMDLSDSLSQKAKELADKLDAKLDETLEKAKKIADKETQEPTSSHADSRNDENELLTRSNLEDKDSFFDKADRFARGQSLKENNRSGKDDEIKNRDQKAYGFEDLDGDGNEIVDDAIIDEDSEENVPNKNDQE